MKKLLSLFVIPSMMLTSTTSLVSCSSGSDPKDREYDTNYTFTGPWSSASDISFNLNFVDATPAGLYLVTGDSITMFFNTSSSGFILDVNPSIELGTTWNPDSGDPMGIIFYKNYAVVQNIKWSTLDITISIDSPSPIENQYK